MAEPYQKLALLNLCLFALTELIGGFLFSLLSPFYAKEASSKGVSVTVSGLVYGVTFLTTIVFSPIFGKYIQVIGSKNLFFYGTLLAGSTSIIFGFLQWVTSPIAFVTLSFLIRILGSIGEAAFVSVLYPLAAQFSDDRHRSTVLSIMETMAGLGMMLGPVVGGFLYVLGGFYLPFIVCGLILLSCTLLSYFLLAQYSGREESQSQEASLTFFKLLQVPTMISSSLILWISSISVCWYMPSLQPFLEKEYKLNSLEAGTMFMIDGGTYALFSPLWGWLLDRGLKPTIGLLLGSSCILFGYILLGPLLPQNLAIVVVALFIHGVGTAANFITVLMYMLQKASEYGLPDSEQTRAMITSLWFINECIGGYIGSSLGGLSYDLYGFSKGTYAMVFLQLISLGLLIPLLYHSERKAQVLENSRLLTHHHQSNKKYNNNNNKGSKNHYNYNTTSHSNSSSSSSSNNKYCEI